MEVEKRMFDQEKRDAGLQNPDALIESFIVDNFLHMDSESQKEFLESAELNSLVEAGQVKKRTIVRLSKKDDYTRRLTLGAIQRAKESNSPDWKRLRKAQAMKKAAIAAILKRYGNTVKRDVVKAQRAVQKLDPTHYVKTTFH